MIKLAEDKIFMTYQGEGHLLGEKSVFVRLAGCSVGCKGCDTAYNKNVDQLDSKEISLHIKSSYSHLKYKWICITGGEPSDQNISELCYEIRNLNREKSISISTSGIKKIDAIYDFISISPHFSPSKLFINSGDQINLVPGLGDLNLSEWDDYEFFGFKHKYITPYAGDKKSIELCFDWIERHPDFRLGVQAHKYWRIK